jgi:hypothetical protein
MHYLPIVAVQVADKQFLGRRRGIEACAEHLGGGFADVGVVRCCEGEERRRLDRVLLVCGRSRGDVTVGVRRGADLGESAHVMQAVGNVLDGYEGEGA